MNKAYRFFINIGIVFFVLALSASSWAVASNEGGVATGEDELSLVLALDSATSSQDPDGGCIASGEMKTGTIFPVGDIDAYTFYGQSGQGVVISLAANSDSFAPWLLLYDPNGVFVESDFGEHTATITYHQLKMTGIYTIVASDASWNLDTVEYGLSLVLAPGATTSPQDREGGNIASGEMKTGNIFPAGDMDAYTFYGQSGQGVVISLAAHTDLFAPWLQLYNPNGVFVESDFGEHTATITYHQLKMTGIYTIVASDGSWNLDSVEYGLFLLLIPSIDSHGLYPYGPQPADGNTVSLSDPNSLSWWSVNGATQYDVSVYAGSCMTSVLQLIKFITTLENEPQNITRVQIPMPTLDANEIYYWQVVAHTPDGDIKGPVWWFSTEP
jgi:hypothetical protein